LSKGGIGRQERDGFGGCGGGEDGLDIGSLLISWKGGWKEDVLVVIEMMNGGGELPDRT
jgi:hypothetical protein